jgi:hypothetical protein
MLNLLNFWLMVDNTSSDFLIVNFFLDVLLWNILYIGFISGLWDVFNLVLNSVVVCDSSLLRNILNIFSFLRNIFNNGLFIRNLFELALCADALSHRGLNWLLNILDLRLLNILDLRLLNILDLWLLNI